MADYQNSRWRTAEPELKTILELQVMAPRFQRLILTLSTKLDLALSLRTLARRRSTTDTQDGVMKPEVEITFEG